MVRRSQGWFLVRSMRRCARDRKGIFLVWMSFLLTTLLAMVGLVVDLGVMMSAHRQAQNAADAGAMAAALDLMRGQSVGNATTTAVTFVKTHNGLGADVPDPDVNVPPASGAYSGAADYVEVVVTNEIQTNFIHALPGVSQDRTVVARAVAGYENVTAGEGVAVLDPRARPGLGTTGQGTLKVLGLVVDNSEGGGVDENGDPVNNGNSGVAAKGTTDDPTKGFFATDFRVVGGVDDQDYFKNVVPGEPNPLKANQLPFPDPLLNLATPTTSNGVDPSFRGNPQATNSNLKLNDPSGVNFIETDTDTGEDWMVIHPGVYESISITGGNVRFFPGIYVITWKSTGGGNALQITGGTVEAHGVMFYNTGHNFNPATGTPDSNDGDNPPPSGGPEDGANFGEFQINAGMEFTPIDLDNTDFDYGGYSGGSTYVPDEAFQGMLFYQRRKNEKPFRVEGNAADGLLAGTLYAKWASVTISGQGTYDAQFVVGSIQITGQGDVTINYSGENLGKAPQVFLVE